MLIFTYTYGRSGTGYLAELFRLNVTELASIHHEHLRPLDWGHNTPDIGVMTQWNTIGGTEDVHRFWKEKFNNIREMIPPDGHYIETSHQLSKGGLIEHLHLLDDMDIKIICLERDWADIAMSLRRRGDWMNKTLMWLWYLDPDYNKNILSEKPNLAFGAIGVGAWYLREQRARRERARRWASQRKNIEFIDVRVENLNTEEGVKDLFHHLGLECKGTVELPKWRNATAGEDPDENVVRNLIKQAEDAA